MILGRNCVIFLRLCVLSYSVERRDGKQRCDLFPRMPRNFLLLTGVFRLVQYSHLVTSVTGKSNCGFKHQEIAQRKIIRELVVLTLNFQVKSSLAVAHSRRREQPFEK